jgi:glycosyltransferase involved in cell wall biosynthesis
MASAPLRIALLGGVPPSLGGGGLEVQLEQTRAALERAGHDAFAAARPATPRPFDVLHAIGAELDVCQHLAHWRRNPAPLVVSPVLVVPPGRERRERLAARLPLASFGPRMRADLLARADLVVALTEHERALAAQLGARRVAVVGNGVAPVPPATPPPGTPAPGYALLLGTVTARKRQADAVRALAGTPTVVAGGLEGSPAERRDFEAALRETGAVWLGEVADPGAVRGLLAGAGALVHVSRAEGQALVLLEALSEGTPVVVSDLPAHRELAAAHPAHVRLVGGLGELRAAIAALGPRPASRPAIPTWDDVAAELVALYRSLVG